MWGASAFAGLSRFLHMIEQFEVGPIKPLHCYKMLFVDGSFGLFSCHSPHGHDNPPDPLSGSGIPKGA
jgi:hypothetical protein